MKSIMSKIIITVFATTLLWINGYAEQPTNDSLDEVTVPTIAENIQKKTEVQGPQNSETININSATAEQLISLKGIGMQKAQAIIEYRKEHGAFKSIDDLKNIKGFSPKTLSKLQASNPNRIIF